MPGECVVQSRSIVIAIMVGACAGSSSLPDGSAADASEAGDGGCTTPLATGRHRLFLQGHQAEPLEDGAYPMLHDEALCDDAVFVDDVNGDGVWQPGEAPRPLGPAGLVHGEHFLVGAGAFAEFRFPLCQDLGGEVAFYIPNFDVAGSRAGHQLLAGGQLLAEAIDDEEGASGYNPFVRVVAGTDPDVSAGDQLILRSTNLNGYQFSVMIWQPPSEYESWILVTVP